MNSCILMAEIVGDPELRSTQDGMNVSNVLIEFEGTREGDPSAKIRLVGWGNLAEEIKNNYHRGDRIIIEGRLSMNLIDMPEGYKEKRAELVASRIYPLGGGGSLETNSSISNDVQFEPSPTPASSSTNAAATPEPTYANPVATESSETDSTDGNWDEIPFKRPVYSKTNFSFQLWDSWELEANRYWDGVKQFV